MGGASFFRFSLETLTLSLLHAIKETNLRGAQLVSIWMATVGCKARTQNITNMLLSKSSNILIRYNFVWILAGLFYRVRLVFYGEIQYRVECSWKYRYNIDFTINTHRLDWFLHVIVNLFAFNFLFCAHKTEYIFSNCFLITCCKWQ